MGILDSFEKGLERAVNGAFARTFRSGLQPIELTSALRRELDTKAAVVSRDRILAPNEFTLTLSPSDHARMTALGPTLTDELLEYARAYADQQGYRFAGGLRIDLAEDGGLGEGMLTVSSSTVQGEVSWTPVVDVNGTRHRLTATRTVLGRGGDADITIDDTGISRKHIEIVWNGRRAEVRDLGSTNGTKLDGRPLKRSALEPDQVIEAGRSRIVFHLVPEASGSRSRPARTEAPTRRNAQIPGFWGEK